MDVQPDVKSSAGDLEVAAQTPRKPIEPSNPPLSSDADADASAARLVALLEGAEEQGLSHRRLASLNKEAAKSLRAFDESGLVRLLHGVYRRARLQHDPGRRKTGRLAAVGSTERASSPVRSLVVVWWLVTAAVTGAVVMALEIAAFRLYAPYLGYSIYVWGTMISVVMLALALGYALGGYLADRSRDDRPLYLLILGSALYQLVIIFTVRKVLNAVASAGDFKGTALATLIVFTPPMAALATAGPFVIRLLMRSGRAGVTAGKVYALSTLGSVAGILLTAFVLVPDLGTQATLILACGTSALVGAAGLLRRHRAALAGIVPIGLLPFAPPADWGAHTVWVRESAYNLVRVVRNGEELKLVLNDERSIATRINVQTGWTGGYYHDFGLGPYLVPGRRALSLGMGAGASILATWAAAPEVRFDAVEIDPQVVEAAKRFFGIDPADPRLSVHVADARPWLARNRERYDIVHVDLYQGGPYIPFYLVTQEFFELVARRMSEDAVLMFNVLDPHSEQELSRTTAATLRQVFPTVVALSRARGNQMLLAFTTKCSLDGIRDALSSVGGDERMAALARYAATAIHELTLPPAHPVFTDDLAPVEPITRRTLKALRP